MAWWKRNASERPVDHTQAPKVRRPLVMALEPRVMFDGAVAATAAKLQPAAEVHAVPVAAHEVAHHTPAAVRPVSPHLLGERGERDLPAWADRTTGHDVLFVDARIQDASSLLAHVRAGTDVVYLQQGRDGLQQMRDYLAAHPGASSVQILAHGNDGDLWLGSTYLSADNIGQHASELSQIGADIKAGGDILIYACDTAAGAKGLSFVTSLANLTHRDVAASSNRMGAGYDWNLEVTTGSIEARPVLSAIDEAGYTHDLAIITVTNGNDSGAGSLRQAITDASTTVSDTITFSSGMTVTLSSGQLSIAKNLTIDGDIDGNGTPDVTIDANYTSRVFSISSGKTVTLDGLVIEHGLVAANGANIKGAGSGALGAAISNAGNLTLNDVTVTANAASGGGGGGGIAASTGGGGGGGGGAIGGGFGGSGGNAGSGFPGTAGSMNQGGHGGGYYYAGYGGGGGNTSGGAGGQAGSAVYMPGGQGGTANNGSISIGGGGGGSGFTSTGGAGGAAAGGIYNTGTLTIIGTSVISNNLGAGGGGGGGGGGAYAFNGGDGGVGVGAIWNQGGTVHITSANFAAMTGNAGNSGSGGTSTGGSNGNTPTSTANIYNNGGTVDTSYELPPVVTNLNGDSGSFTEGGAVLHIDSGSDASVTDSDNANFSGGNVTVSIVTNRVSGEDVLGIENQGSGPGQIGISGSNVTYGGVTIGTFSGGTGTSDLVISLNASATPTATTALVHALTYKDTNNADPATATRTVRVTVNDGSGGTSTASDVSVSVIGVNDAPTLSATTSTPTYTENGSAASLFSGASISTIESGQTIKAIDLNVSNVTDGSAEILSIDGTDVALTNGNSATTATNGMSVSVSVSGSTATIAISKAAGISTAAAQTLVNGISYRDATDAPTAGNRVVTLTSVQDSGGTSNGGVDTTALSIASTVTVVAVNDAPVVTTSGGTTGATEQVGVVVDGGITVADVDNTTLASAAVSITGNFHSGEDVLAFSNTNAATYGNIAASYNAGTGVLTLTSAGASATVAQWQAALRAVTYTDTSDTPSTATRTVSFIANDGTDNSTVATKSVSVAAVNDAPVVTASGGITSASEQVAIAVDGGIAVVDVDNTTLASATVSITGNFHSGEDVLAFSNTNAATYGNIAASYNTGTGVLTLTSAGASATVAQWQAALRAVTYTDSSDTPNTATRTVSFIANDGTDDSLVATKSVSVTAVNDAPTVSGLPGSISITEDTAGNLDISASSFADPDSASISVTLSVSGGSIGLANPTGYSITASGNGTSTVVLTGSAANINSYLDTPSNAVFTPPANVNGNGAATLTISANDHDGSGDVALGSVPINIAAVNDAPVNTVPGGQSMLENGTLVFSSGNGNLVSVSDVDASGGLEQVTLTVSHGTLSLAGTTGLSFLVGSGSGDTTMTFTGTLTDINAAINGLAYTPGSNYLGADTLQITTNDLGNTGSGGAQTDTSNVAISVLQPIPLVTDVSSTSANGGYKVGDTVLVTVDFDQAVTVDTAGGTPTLLLETGSVDHAATYLSGSGSNTLTFSYTVQAGDSSADLDYASTSALALNGATIRDISGDDANLTLPATGSANSLAGQKDIVVDGIAPTVGSVSVPANGTYVAGQNLDFTVTYSEAVTVDTTGGTPSLDITLDTGGVVHASYLSGSGTSALVFRYTVVSGEADSNGIAVGSAVSENGGSIQDAVGNAEVATLHGVASTTGVRVDAIAPTAVSIVRDDASPSNASSVSYTVTFSENVSGVDATDFALASTGTASGSVGSVTAVDGHTYTVTVNGIGGDGSLALNLNASGTGIVDAAGNALAGGLAGAAYSFDHTAPTISSVSVPANGTYVAGQNLDFTVTYSEAVTVDTTGGTPSLDITLDTGGVVHASYLSGSGTSALVFRYTVVSGEADSDGIAVGSAVSENGGSIQDAVGNAEVATLHGVASTTGVRVDAIAPTAVSIVRNDASPSSAGSLGYTVTFSEDVSGVDAGDFSLLTTGSVSGTVGSVVRVDAHTYTVTVTDVKGGGTLALDLNASGTGIVDLAGNALGSGQAGETYSINGVAPVILVAPTPPPAAPAFANTTATPLLTTLQHDELPTIFFGGAAPPRTLELPASHDAGVLAGLAMLPDNALHLSDAASRGGLELAPSAWIAPGRPFSLRLPGAVASASDRSFMQVTLADGRPLPPWLVFDPMAGTLDGVAPRDFSGALPLRLLVRDSQGHMRTVWLDLSASTEHMAKPLDHPPAKVRPEHAAAKPVAAKPALQAQFGQQRQPGGIDQAQLLRQLAVARQQLAAAEARP